MPRAVEPQVFLIAETRLIGDLEGYYPLNNPMIEKEQKIGLRAFLAALGVPNWRTDDVNVSDAEQLAEVAGKSCYLSFSTDLNKNLTKVGTRTNFDYLQDGIIKTKHGSVLEHASMTFALVDVSRVLTHELVRHRAGCAFSQVSGRYVRTDELAFFLPKIIRANPEATQKFEHAFEWMEQVQKVLREIFDIDNMKDFHLKKMLTSAFRRLIGNGQANHIIFTANHRALRHIIEMRTSRQAEEEIRLVFAKVFHLVFERYPAFYADAVVSKVDDIDEVVFSAGKI